MDMTDMKGKIYVVVVDDESSVLTMAGLFLGSIVGDENVYKAGNLQSGTQLAGQLYSDQSKKPLRWYVDGLEGDWREMVDYIVQNGGCYKDICMFTSKGDFIKEARELGCSAIQKPKINAQIFRADLEAYLEGLVREEPA